MSSNKEEKTRKNSSNKCDSRANGLVKAYISSTFC